MADDHHPASPLEALNARGLTAKREYVRGLEQRHDPEALSLLTECLCDESTFLRDLAEQAFFRLGEAHADALIPLLAGGLWYTRLSAARLLGRIGYRPGVPALLELCDDRSETVAVAAREAIVAIARQRSAGRVAHALHRLAPAPRQRRLDEIAERDRALAKNIERLMTDVNRMADDHPDRMLDPEEPAAAATARQATKAPRPAAKPAVPAPPAAGSAAASAPSPSSASAPRAKPPEAAAGAAQKPRAPRAPAAPVPGPTRKPPAQPSSAPPPTPAATPTTTSPPPASAASPAPAPPAPPAAPEPDDARPGS